MESKVARLLWKARWSMQRGGESGCKLFFTVGCSHLALALALDSRVGEQMAMAGRGMERRRDKQRWAGERRRERERARRGGGEGEGWEGGRKRGRGKVSFLVSDETVAFTALTFTCIPRVSCFFRHSLFSTALDSTKQPVESDRETKRIKRHGKPGSNIPRNQMVTSHHQRDLSCLHHRHSARVSVQQQSTRAVRAIHGELYHWFPHFISGCLRR